MTNQPAITSSPQRHAMVAAIRQHHDSQLRHGVARHATPDTAIVTRACRDAWTQLIDAQHGDPRRAPPQSLDTSASTRGAHCACARETERAGVA
jgi:hypothetical protein